MVMSQHPACRSSSSCLSITDRKGPDNLSLTFRGCWGGRQPTFQAGGGGAPAIPCPRSGHSLEDFCFHSSLLGCSTPVSFCSGVGPGQCLSVADNTHLPMGQEPRAYLQGPGSMSWRRTLGPPAGGSRQGLAVETMDSCRTGAPWTL